MNTTSTATVDTAAFLEREREPILSAAGAALARSAMPHYDREENETVRGRLSALLDRLVEALSQRDLGPMIEHAEHIADERFEAGYDLFEVQVAFNALEEASWARVLDELEPAELAQAIGLITTVLGTGKDALARRYVSRAAAGHVASLDLRALFAGTP